MDFSVDQGGDAFLRSLGKLEGVELPNNGVLEATQVSCFILHTWSLR